jgi:5-methylcytosine-specific restriction enzyme A
MIDARLRKYIDMPIYRRCGRCGKRLPSGTKCECLKERHKEYDKYSRDKVSDDFYHSKEWEIARDDAISYYAGLDIYSYYIEGILEYGQTVHHIIPLKDDWNKRTDRINLIYLTDSNHQLIHKAMREGKYNEMIELLNGLVERYEQEFGVKG